MTIHVLDLKSGAYCFLYCPDLTLNGKANAVLRESGIPYFEGSARERTIYRFVDLFRPEHLQNVIAVLRLAGFTVEVEEGIEA